MKLNSISFGFIIFWTPFAAEQEAFIMTDNFSETKWNTFASTGKITDYLEFKGAFAKTFGGKTCGLAGTTQTPQTERQNPIGLS